MSDQREAVEMAGMVLHRHECRDQMCTAPECDLVAWPRHRLEGADVTLARAVIALDEECRRRFDLAAFFDAKAAWSRETFGPGDRYAGVIAHIRKELDEIEAEPSEAVEWIDVVLLAMDGAWRSAGLDGGEFVAVLKAKDGANRMRTWPDWRTLKPGEVSEHVKPAPSSPGASEPSEVDVEAVAHRLMLVWMEHQEQLDDCESMLSAMSFDEAVALAREAIRLGADPGRAR